MDKSERHKITERPCRASPSLSLSLFATQLHPPPRNYEDGKNRWGGMGFSGVEEELSWKILSPSDRRARFFLAAVSRGRSAWWTRAGGGESDLLYKSRGGEGCKFPSTRARWFRKARNNARPFSIVLRLFVALLAARKATAFLNAFLSLALRLTPANAARWTGARTIARASLIIAVALPCRGGSQPSFSSTRGLIELKTRRGENSKIYMDVDMDAPTHRFLFRFYAKFWNV